MTPTRAIRRLGQLPATVVDAEIEHVLRATLVVLWDNGWQPHEVVRQVRRDRSTVAGRLATVVVVADHAGRHADTLDPGWAAQVAALSASVPPGTGGVAGWFARWREQESLDRGAGLTLAVEVLSSLTGVGPESPNSCRHRATGDTAPAAQPRGMGRRSGPGSGTGVAGPGRVDHVPRRGRGVHGQGP